MLKRLARYGLAACLACTLALAPLTSRAEDGAEYTVKAAMIARFVLFVEWPDGLAIGRHSSIDVCVIGNSPLSDADNVFKAFSTSKLIFNLKKERSAAAAAQHCHIVFIGPSEEDHLGEVLGALKGKPVLTVSDIDDFIDHGGMIGFIPVGGKIKFEVNMKPVDASGLHIEAEMLESALKVIGLKATGR